MARKPLAKSRKAKADLPGLTSDYVQNQRAANAAMTPAQRRDYQARSTVIGTGLLAAGAAIATRGAIAGPVAALRVATGLATSAGMAFAIGSNPSRVIAPNAAPKPVVKPAIKKPGPIAR